MSVGLKLLCAECKTCVYIGTWNTYKVEDPETVGKFLWKHKKHYIIPLDESATYYYDFKEDTPTEED